MNQQLTTSMLILSLFICSCTSDQKGSQFSSSDKTKTTSETPDNIFKEMSDKVKELDQEEGLSVLMEKYKKEDGSTVFDDVLKEIQIEDEASGGQVSDMINLILSTAEKELDVDVSENMEKAMEHANRLPKEFEGNFKDILKTIEESGHTETVENVLEGLNDLLNNSGENGGFKKILREVVDMSIEGNPDLADTELIKEAEEILNRDLLSAEEEAEKMFYKIFEQNKDLLEQVKQYQ